MPFFILLALGIGPMGPDAPAREPQFAVHGSTIALAFGASHAIYFARSTDAGQTFTTPVKVAESPVLPLTRHRGPRIAFAGSSIVITAVMGKTAAEGTHAHGLPSDGDLIAWRSTDEGRTWSKGLVVNDAAGAATEGLHALASSATGALFAAWLDKRDGKTKLYGAKSADGGLTWSANTLIYASPDGTICECCHPSAAFDHEGKTLVMWRNWLDGARDMYLASSGDGKHFSTRKLGEGVWKLNACPMDGGGIAESDHGVVTAWRRDHSVFLDQPGNPETEIGRGTDVAITAGKDGVYVIWSTPDSIELLGPLDRTPRALGSKGSFPAIAALPQGGALAAWEDNGTIAIRLVK
ncbi:MAG TPA: sialidase family protein [Bryobacteraceae bacterium]|nr:sialidase family protein [Bryobacteraceae bacterium]